MLLRAGVWATKKPPRQGKISLKHSEAAEQNGDLDFDEQLEQPENFTILVSLLRRYCKAKFLTCGRLVHAHLSKCGYDCYTSVESSLLEMYGHCGHVEDAKAMFDRMLSPKLYLWTTLMKAYADNGQLEDAKNTFNRMPYRDVVSWNAMMSSFLQHGQGNEALELFYRMQTEGIKPNNVTFICALDACASLQALDKGHEIHSAVLDGGYGQHVLVGTALITMYGKCGSVHMAETVFSSLPHRNAVSWTGMIAAFAWNGHSKAALNLFRQMQLEGINPDKITFLCLLDACINVTALKVGKEIHAATVHSSYGENVMVGTALVNMYGKCESVHEAVNVFEKLTHRDNASWNALITACGQNYHCKEALDFFCQMQHEGVEPDNVTFVCALEACASLVALEEGKMIYTAIIDNGFELDVIVGSSLISLYGKCGSVYDARNVFGRISHRSVVSWNAMIAVLSHNGHGKQALSLFHQMQIEGVEPDDITFICVLTACSHTGAVDFGRHFFVSMRRDHGIAHIVAHYLCMIDLLGRAGHLEEAENLIHNMSSENATMAWHCLLGACRTHDDVERGVRAANNCFRSEPMKGAPYVLLSNLYAGAGRMYHRLCDRTPRIGM